VQLNQVENSQIRKVVEVKAILPSTNDLRIVYTLYKKENRLDCHCSFIKLVEKEKESLHLALPLAIRHPELHYGNQEHTLIYGKDQLPGSNQEFICVEDELMIDSDEGIRTRIRCPKIALYEVGQLMDENKTNGAKIWKTDVQPTSPLFLYVLNNYWHTNYKAFQDGPIDFKATLMVEKQK
jgi:hypothetical protein